jgi:hypothetical protein
MKQFDLRYTENPTECYRVVRARKDGDVYKYKVLSVKNRPIEYPNNAIIQSLSKRFMTQRSLEPIYSASYGVDWAKFIGRDMDADLILTIEQEIRDAMMVSDFVEDVNVDVGELSGDSLLVNCTVTIKDKYIVNGANNTAVLRTVLNL